VLLGNTVDMGTQNAAVTADGWLATLTGQLPNSIYKSMAKQRALRVKSVKATGKTLQMLCDSPERVCWLVLKTNTRQFTNIPDVWKSVTPRIGQP
jgi:hypothetical protein